MVTVYGLNDKIETLPIMTQLDKVNIISLNYYSDETAKILIKRFHYLLKVNIKTVKF
jgi:hypothetical protein